MSTSKLKGWIQNNGLVIFYFIFPSIFLIITISIISSIISSPNTPIKITGGILTIISAILLFIIPVIIKKGLIFMILFGGEIMIWGLFLFYTEIWEVFRNTWYIPLILTPIFPITLTIILLLLKNASRKI